MQSSLKCTIGLFTSYGLSQRCADRTFAALASQRAWLGWRICSCEISGGDLAAKLPIDPLREGFALARLGLGARRWVLEYCSLFGVVIGVGPRKRRRRPRHQLSGLPSGVLRWLLPPRSALRQCGCSPRTANRGRYLAR
jgi:hypothetical protein